MIEELVVDNTGMVRKRRILHGPSYEIVADDKPYMPHGKHVFVNPETNFLEEGELPRDPIEEMINLMTQGIGYNKISEFESNGNSVVFHPTRKEFAEVEKGWMDNGWAKVRDFFF